MIWPSGWDTFNLSTTPLTRAIVSFPASSWDAVARLAADHGVPLDRIGEVTETPALEVLGQFTLELDEVRRRWEAPIREAMAGH